MILDGAGALISVISGLHMERVMRSRSLLHVSLLLATCILAGCGARTNVSATSNVTSEYSHVWITVTDVKFNTSATAAPGASSWLDFPLSTPITVDLATVTNGNMAIFGSSLKIPQGTYQQMELMLSDTTASLTSSASTAGLQFNDEVQYLNSAGSATTAPLNLINPTQGIVLAVTLSVPSNLKAELEALDEGATNTDTDETGTTGTTGTTGGLGFGGTETNSTTGLETTTPVCTPTTTTSTLSTDTTTTPLTDTTDNCTSTTNTQFAVAIDFDAERDLVPFIFSNQPGFLLNPHLTAYDLSTAGTIQATLNLNALAGSSCTSTTTTGTTTGTSTITSSTASGNPAIEVSAETLSSDGTRHVVVLSAPLQSDGSFVLYPLTTDATSAGATTTTTYDLVVHGPQIQTVIIKSVPPSVSAPSAATSASLSGICLATAADFLVNVSTSNHFTTPGALVQFYQTVPVSGEVPYVIAQQPIDPFNLDFAGDAALAAGPIAVTFYSGANAATPVSEAPSEGSGAYRVSAIAPNYNDGSLTPTVTAPATITTTPLIVSLSPLSVATGAEAETLSVETSVISPGKYDGGELILTANGAIIAVASLTPVLNESAGSVTLTNIPGGSSENVSAGNYALSAWVWNTSNPAGTLSRQSSPTSISLSGGSTHASITID
jgi:hypothetical protein